MYQKRFVIIAFILLSVMFFGCIKLKEKQLPKIIVGEEEVEEKPSQPIKVVPSLPQKKESAPCMDIPITKSRDLCFLSLAKNTSNETICQFIYGENEQQRCFYPFANLSLAACRHIINVETRDSCIEFHALKIKNDTVCNEIKDDKKRQNCINLLVPPCLSDEVSEAERDRCFAWETKDYKRCEDDDCLFDYALEFRLSDACYNIKNESRKLGCIGIVSDKQGDECQNASQKSIADLCYLTVATYTNNSYWCSFASEKSVYRNECYRALSTALKDASLCSKSDTTILADDCYLNYAKISGQAHICENIFSETKKDSCYRGVAIEHGYMSHCNNIRTAYGRSSCFSAVAFGHSEKKINVEGCKGVLVEEWKNKCYTSAAVSQKDKSICDLIEREDAQKMCRSAFD
ncbi:MAG: hypothetical protein QXN01_03785 [Candidatus Anstonellales archaeon]